MFGFNKKIYNFNKRTLDDLKKITEILIIDDHDSSLIKILEKEGWSANYLKDLDNYSNQYLSKSHIICLDIHGVGKKLNCKDGLELAGYIKDKYPNKKIVLYSTEPNHNIFDDNINIVDKRIYKSGQSYPFIKSIEELSMQIFDWESCVKDLYEKYKKEFSPEITFDKFEKEMSKLAKGDKLNADDISGVISASLDIATKIALLINACSNFVK